MTRERPSGRSLARVGCAASGAPANLFPFRFFLHAGWLTALAILPTSLALWTASASCEAFIQRRVDQPPSAAWIEPLLRGVVGSRSLASPRLNDAERAGIHFLGSDRLVVYGVGANPSHLATRASAGIVGSHQLTISIIDANSGRLIITRAWPTTMHHSSVQIVASGILIHTGSSLQVMSEDLTAVRTIELPSLSAPRTWVLSTSPNGRTALVNRYNNRASHFDVLDGEHLSIMSSWEQAPPVRTLYSVSQNYIAAADFNQQNVIASKLGSARWHLVATKSQVGCIGIPTLVTDTWVANACKSLDVISLAGQFLAREPSRKSKGFEPEAAVCSNGEFIAISVERTKGRDFWDTGEVRTTARQVLVYDVVRKRRVRVADVNPLPQSNYGYALSPDGSELAIMNDENVAVYRIGKSRE